MLLSDVDLTAKENVSYAIVGLIGVIIGKFFGLLDDRDKRRHDLRIQKLELHVEDCDKQKNDCLDQLKETRKEIRNLLEETRKELCALRAQIESLQDELEKAKHTAGGTDK